MKKSFLLYICFVIAFASGISAQPLIMSDSAMHPDRYISKYLPILSDKELMKIASLPLLNSNLPNTFQNKITLPYMVDNSTQPYLIPITWQGGYECGQSASIAFNFTYEIDYLRGLSCAADSNQYVTHFSWNFLNNGYNYTGASYYDSWEIVRMCGTPNKADYGGNLWTGGERRWMSGYDLYYKAMKNRNYTIYNINVGTPEGLSILKHWIHNHLNGSAVGGIAHFYAQYQGPNATLPAGTPEAGKYVMSSWGSSPSHTWTIVGYNDSIRYDFNNDGLYTNHIDINGDGIISMNDWEIGGLKFLNGYAGPGWGNNGFCYLMYKALADDISDGGIWNHRTTVTYVKPTYNPLLTYKIGLKHDVRNRIRVNAGISMDPAASKPDIVLDFPIFNYQGGEYYMQGDSTEPGKSIEFGLDISPLLSFTQPGQDVKFFLQVMEKDPSATATGEVLYFSLLDYTSGFQQSDCPQTNININNNDTTRLSISKIINFNKVNIVNNVLPEAVINQPYTLQMNATGGTTPYHWDFDLSFDETNTTGAVFPAVTAHPLTLNNSNTGYAVQNIAFDFPFYGKKYNKVYVYADGFIKFDNEPYTWPYLRDATLLFRSTRIIAPFLADLYIGSGDNIWYEGNSQYAIFRWKMHVSGQSSNYVNCAVKIFPDGNIEFYYENILVSSSISWIAGIARGDNFSWQFSSLSGKFLTNSVILMTSLNPPEYPFSMSISDDGVFSGVPEGEFNNLPVRFKVTDNNNIFTTKTLNFTTGGILSSYSILSGTDSIVNAGEQAQMNIALKNIGSTTINAAQMTLQTGDPFITMTDSLEYLGNLTPDDSLVFPAAFAFYVDTLVSDNYIVEFILTVFNAADTFETRIFVPVRSLVLTTGNISIADGNNNIPEPGETGALIVQIKNIGGAAATGLQAVLSTNDPYTNVQSNTYNAASLSGGSSVNAFFIIDLLPSAPIGHIVIFNLDLTANGGYHSHHFFAIQIGGNTEDWESADMQKYPWVTNGDTLWEISTQLPYEGLYCLKSGDISENQQTSVFVELNILNDGDVSFYKKVSCEAHPGVTDYDFLAFFIDGAEMGRWDGVTAWQQHSYPVTAGTHTFKWSYTKDYSVSSGEDCAWLDYIVFPPSIDIHVNASQSPANIFKSQKIDTLGYDSILIVNNNTAGVLLYECYPTAYSANSSNFWLQPEVNYGSIDPASSGNLQLIFDSYGLTDDTYNCTLNLHYNFMDTIQIPITFQVYVPTSIAETPEEIFVKCHPNPFTSSTNFYINLPQTSQLSIVISDIHGRVVNIPYSGILNPGNQKIEWNAADNKNGALSPGVYIYKITTDFQTFTGRLIFSR